MLEVFNQDGKKEEFDIKNHLLDLTKEQQKQIIDHAHKDDTLGEDMKTHRVIYDDIWDTISEESQKVIAQIYDEIENLKKLQESLEDKIISKNEIYLAIDKLRKKCEKNLKKIKDTHEKELENHLLNEIKTELPKIHQKIESMMNRYSEVDEKIEKRENILDAQRSDLN